MNRVSLESEVFYQQELKKRSRAWKWQRNRKAIQDFASFLVALGVIYLAFFAIRHMPTWMPIVRKFLGHA